MRARNQQWPGWYVLPKPSLASLIMLYCPWLLCASGARAQLDFEAAPIHYNTAPVNDRVQTLATKLSEGKVQLAYDQQHGYLKAVLEALDVPVSSQALVFSKTSFQLRRIAPERPRAVYFTDDVYVGWVQGGDVVEISAADPHQGGIFYTVSQTPADPPKIIRDRGQCIACHASSRTQGVPGHLVRSVYPSSSGQPFYGSGTFTSNHRSPLSERWGGWYVTGTHGRQRHMGNVIAQQSDNPEALDVEAGANITSLETHLDTSPYLSPHSDIVALMVLEHQTHMQNLITRANFTARSADHYDRVMNKAMGRPEDYRSDSARRRIDRAVDKLVAYMLFAGEIPITDAIQGTSTFHVDFAARGPHDKRGRSLRDLDMHTRMFRYPCSYLIYTKSFDSLPDEVKQPIYERLFAILSGEDNDQQFRHLSESDRRAVLEILRQTKSDLPGYWYDKS